MTENAVKFKKGISDGLPICFGYFAVAFAFGIFAVESGMSVLQSLLISMTNVTSAGQLAAVPIIAGGGTLLELAVAQFVINLRYSLMSLSLSQKIDKKFSMVDRLVISFVNTDEVFAVSSSQKGSLCKAYMYGLIITPYLGWSAGTVIGAVAGNVLPEVVISSLGLAIYGMFIAIVVPETKKSRPVALCVLLAVALSCAFRYIPALNGISQGFVIIICSVVASAVFAVVAPIDVEKKEGEADE